MGDPEQQQLIESAAELGIVVTKAQARQLLAHLEAVLEANKRLNLTAIADRERAMTLHIVDSLAVSPHVAEATGRIADIGSGAGFPGVPIAIVSQRAVDLIESVKKKAGFLRECVDALGGLSGSEVLAHRAEEVAAIRAGRYQHVIARALTSLPSLVELASPLLATGGKLWSMKGTPGSEELNSGAAAAELCGMREVERFEYTLPGSGERRMLVGYVKSSEPRIALPRRVGLAQKRPLA